MSNQQDYENSPLYKIRHSLAHVMAQAVLEMFPTGKIAIGPPIEDGFYYDFARAEPFTESDLEKIEKKMKELVKQDIPLERSVMPREAAIDFFANMGEAYKAELIERSEEHTSELQSH